MRAMAILKATMTATMIWTVLPYLRYIKCDNDKAEGYSSLIFEPKNAMKMGGMMFAIEFENKPSSPTPGVDAYDGGKKAVPAPTAFA